MSLRAKPTSLSPTRVTQTRTTSKKHGWGHSTVREAANFAARARAKELHLFHHDPDHTDADIDAKLTLAQSLLAQSGAKTVAVAPAEGQTFRF